MALGPDEANLTGALEWAHVQGEDELVAALCTGLQYYWRDRGRTAASLRYLPWGVEAATHIAGDRKDREDRLRASRLSLTYGVTLQMIGQLDAAERAYHEALAIRREVQDRRGEGADLTNLGQVAQARGQLDAAAGYFEQALAIRREVQDRQGEGVVLSNLGQVAQARGQLDAAAGYFEQALAIRQEVQDRQGEGVDLAQLGLIAHARVRWDEAENYFRRCLALMEAVQDALNEATIALILGEFLITERHAREEGCALIQRAVGIRQELGLSGEDEARATARRLGCLAGEEERGAARDG